MVDRTIRGLELGWVSYFGFLLFGFLIGFFVRFIRITRGGRVPAGPAARNRRCGWSAIFCCVSAVSNRTKRNGAEFGYFSGSHSVYWLFKSESHSVYWLCSEYFLGSWSVQEDHTWGEGPDLAGARFFVGLTSHKRRIFYVLSSWYPGIMHAPFFRKGPSTLTPKYFPPATRVIYSAYVRSFVLRQQWMQLQVYYCQGLGKLR